MPELSETGLPRAQDLCRVCRQAEQVVVYELYCVPVHCGLLLPTLEAARRHPTGGIRLGFCRRCGFSANLDFNPELLNYSSEYDETQAFSATFTAFHRHLAGQLIRRYDIREKDVIEIGCGRGEFLALLCSMGNNRGIGFDPAYGTNRVAAPPGCDVSFVTDFYSETYARKTDVVCCNMTLEHIHRPADFLRTIRRSLNSQPDALVYFLLPDAARIFHEAAFWDVYYEHCSYFTSSSLTWLFASCGFDIIAVENEYQDQYLSIAARPAKTHVGDTGAFQVPQAMEEAMLSFAGRCDAKSRQWRETIDEYARRGQRTIIWGGGSKAVAFLVALGLGDQVDAVVDINPRRQDTYIAGSGHRIVGPEYLREHQPDLVLIMNPVYTEEIQQALHAMGLHPQILVCQ